MGLVGGVQFPALGHIIEEHGTSAQPELPRVVPFIGFPLGADRRESTPGSPLPDRHPPEEVIDAIGPGQGDTDRGRSGPEPIARLSGSKIRAHDGELTIFTN